MQPSSQFDMGHYYWLESSEIDLLFVGGQVSKRFVRDCFDGEWNLQQQLYYCSQIKLP